MRKVTRNTKGFALVELLIILVVLVALGGIGAYAYHRSHETKKTSTSSTSDKSSSQTSKSNTTTTDPYTGWQKYCSAQEKSCFKYPADWTTKDVGAVDPAGDGLQITSPNGTVIWFQSSVSGLGGACQTGTADVFNHKVTASPNVANLYIVESGTEGAVNHIGLVDALNGQEPKTGDTGSCVSATTFTSKHDASVNAWFESNGTSSFNQSDLDTAVLIMKSYTY
jgi:hypothetical protein